MSQGGWLAKKQIDMGRTAVWGTRPVRCISQHTFLLRSHGSQAHGTCPLGLLQVDSRWAFRILRIKPAPTYGFLAQKSGDLLQMPLATISESRNGLHQCLYSQAALLCRALCQILSWLSLASAVASSIEQAALSRSNSRSAAAQTANDCCMPLCGQFNQ